MPPGMSKFKLLFRMKIDHFHRIPSQETVYIYNNCINLDMSTVVYSDFKDYIVSCIFGLGNDSYDFSSKGMFLYFERFSPLNRLSFKKNFKFPSKK